MSDEREEYRKPCIKCLLSKEMQEKEYETVHSYIDNISDEDKLSETEYHARLEICKLCEFLRSGICGKCGCYVEVRSIRKNGYCPHENARW